METNWLVAAAAAVVALVLLRRNAAAKPSPKPAPTPAPAPASEKTASMTADKTGKPFTPAELATFDGQDPSQPVYVAIKGTVFDVSSNREQYAPGKGYSVFAGKDASRALGMSKLELEYCVADYSTLNEEELKTLDNWHSFFAKKYPVVGYTVPGN